MPSSLYACAVYKWRNEQAAGWRVQSNFFAAHEGLEKLCTDVHCHCHTKCELMFECSPQPAPITLIHSPQPNVMHGVHQSSVSNNVIINESLRQMRRRSYCDAMRGAMRPAAALLVASP